MEIFISVLTSTITSSIFVFIFKESVKAKFELIKRKIEIISSYQAKDFDFTREAVTTIWTSFSRLDDYIRYDYPDEVSNGHISPECMRPYFLEIKSKMVLLPEELYETCNIAIDNLYEAWNKSSNEILNLSNVNDITSNQYNINLKEANKALNELKKSVSEQLHCLRKSFREYIKNHIVE